MCSAFRDVVALIAALMVGASALAAEPSTQPAAVLRVAADPNNLPFSNNRLEGFENKIAELVARDMGAKLAYVWHAQRRGFFRETVKSGDADVAIGVPTALDMALTTRPYYRSTYVFLSRKDAARHVTSFDDPVLKQMRIGIQIVGDENTPPAQALGRRGIAENVVGYSVYGDYAQDNPPARIVEAVACNEVDVAVVWGPLAGYFAQKQRVSMQLDPVAPQLDPPGLPFAFDISMGVKKGNAALKRRLDEIIARRQTDIDRILAEYHVPQAPHDRPLQESSP